MKTPLVTNQIEVSLLENSAFTSGRVAYLQERGVRPMAWSPLAGGLCSRRTMQPCFKSLQTLPQTRTSHQKRLQLLGSWRIRRALCQCSEPIIWDVSRKSDRRQRLKWTAKRGLHCMKRPMRRGAIVTHAAPKFQVDPSAFRSALGKFATGVALVSTRTDAGPMGIMVNSFASVSLDPPLVLWSIDKNSKRRPSFEVRARNRHPYPRG